jgi:hypothetical protein
MMRLLLISFTTWAFAASAQSVDSVQLDLEQLSDDAFFKKYSVHDSLLNKDDIAITKTIWSLSHFQKINTYLSTQGVPTLTWIIEKPSQSNPYYLIGLYQLPTPLMLRRMGYYRIHNKNKTIDYQDLDHFIEDKWIRIN